MNHSKEGPIIFSDVPTLVKSPSKIYEDDSSSSESSLTSFYGMVLHEKDPCHHPAHLCNSKRASGKTTINHQVLDVKESFSWFRAKYILSYIAITLSDALQATHIYVLYEGYGYSPAILYALGFFSGAVFSPMTGAFIDRIGRKKSALLYCVLEIGINSIEQYPLFYGLVAGRILGGITTNIYCSVFESYLITEVRKRGFSEKQLEQVLCDCTIVANSSSILSGLMAHSLAIYYGPVGPFQGAVSITAIALILITNNWSENHGTLGDDEIGMHISTWGYLKGACNTIRLNPTIAKVGLIQGLVEGTLETFLFLWSPALALFASKAPLGTIGLDYLGDPAYGLIFGVFMFFAVSGSIVAPAARRKLAYFAIVKLPKLSAEKDDDDDDDETVDPLPLNILCSLLYFASALFFLVPCLMEQRSSFSFTLCLLSFVMYQFAVGAFEPLEGMVRSIYIPSGQVCSIVNILRVVTNIFIAIGVYSTTHVSVKVSFGCLSAMMAFASLLQLTLISRSELLQLASKLFCASCKCSSYYKQILPITFAILSMTTCTQYVLGITVTGLISFLIL